MFLRKREQQFHGVLCLCEKLSRKNALIGDFQIRLKFLRKLENLGNKTFQCLHIFTKESKADTFPSVKKPLLYISWYSILAHILSHWQSTKVEDHTIYFLHLSHIAALSFPHGKGKSQGSLQQAARSPIY